MSKFEFLYEDPTSTFQVIGNTPYGIYDSDNEHISKPTSQTTTNTATTGFSSAFLGFSSRLQLSSLGL